MSRIDSVWRLIAFGAGLALLLSYPVFVEGRWIETTRTRVELAGLERPFRLLHLSDLHLGHSPNQSQLESIALKAVAEKPDLICLTGDYVDGHFILKRASLESVIEILSKAAPTYAVLGNHDGGIWAAGNGDMSNAPVRERLEKGGAVILHNRWEKIRVRGQEILLVGTGDLWSDEVDAVSSFRKAPAGLPTILLTHNPDTKDAVGSFSWQLMLAGHTHGNQVNLPFWDESWATVRDQRYISGLNSWNGRQIHVNRGIGGVGGIRFRSRPEISILEVVPRI